MERGGGGGGGGLVPVGGRRGVWAVGVKEADEFSFSGSGGGTRTLEHAVSFSGRAGATLAGGGCILVVKYSPSLGGPFWYWARILLGGATEILSLNWGTSSYSMIFGLPRDFGEVGIEGSGFGVAYV